MSGSKTDISTMHELPGYDAPTILRACGGIEGLRRVYYLICITDGTDVPGGKDAVSYQIIVLRENKPNLRGGELTQALMDAVTRARTRQRARWCRVSAYKVWFVTSGDVGVPVYRFRFPDMVVVYK